MTFRLSDYDCEKVVVTQCPLCELPFETHQVKKLDGSFTVERCMAYPSCEFEAFWDEEGKFHYAYRENEKFGGGWL